MRAVLSKQPGPPSSLVVETIERPEPGPGEVLIAVEAASLNFFDTLIIQDRYQYRPERPFSPGAECAGRVAAVGAFGGLARRWRQVRGPWIWPARSTVARWGRSLLNWPTVPDWSVPLSG